MITSGSRVHPPTYPHQRVIPRHGRQRGFAWALAPRSTNDHPLASLSKRPKPSLHGRLLISVYYVAVIKDLAHFPAIAVRVQNLSCKQSLHGLPRVQTKGDVVQLTHLETYAAVVRAGSVSAAARALFYSQPTVTAHVNALEKDLGTRLLERSRHGVCTTSAGDEVFDSVILILGLVSGLHKGFAAVDRVASGGFVEALTCLVAEGGVVSRSGIRVPDGSSISTVSMAQTAQPTCPEAVTPPNWCRSPNSSVGIPTGESHASYP